MAGSWKEAGEALIFLFVAVCVIIIGNVWSSASTGIIDTLLPLNKEENKNKRVLTFLAHAGTVTILLLILCFFLLKGEGKVLKQVLS